MQKDATLARLMLTLGGNTMGLAGYGGIGVGSLFLTHKFSGYGIRLIDYIPELAGFRRENPQSQANNDLAKQLDLRQEAKYIVKLALVVALSTAVRIASNFMSAEKTISAVENALYRVGN